MLSEWIYGNNYFKKIKSLYSLYCAQTCNEFVGPFAATLRLGTTVSFEEKLQLWRAVATLCSILPAQDMNP